MVWNRRLKNVLIAGTAALLLSAPAAAAVLVLNAKATVPGGKVRLQDIAQVQEGDAELRKKIEGVDLGRAPNPGYTRFVSKEIIASRLRTQGIDPASIRFEGAEGALIQVKAAMLNGGELANLGKEYLQAQLSELDGDFVVETERTPEDLLVPVGAGLTSFNIKWHGMPRATGAASLDLEVLVDGERFTTVPLLFNVRRFGEVLMAVHDIDRDEPFHGTNTTVVRTEITHVKGNIAQDTGEMAALVARRAIKAGTVIRMEDGYPPLVVLKGQNVNVIVKKGSLLIRSRGIARQNGAAGDTVQVANPDSGRIFRCRVTGLNQVTVNL